MNGSWRYAIPRLYYLVTPAFIALDYWAGVNVRVAVLDGLPLYKNLYYGFCVLCGVVVYLLPVSSPFVALGESSVNVLLTILALFLPYVQNIQRLADLEGNWKAAETFSTEGAVNLVLAATMAVIGFVQSNKALSDRFEQATRGSSSWHQRQNRAGPL
jgi:hypothetical protein